MTVLRSGGAGGHTRLARRGGALSVSGAALVAAIAAAAIGCAQRAGPRDEDRSIGSSTEAGARAGGPATDTPSSPPEEQEQRGASQAGQGGAERRLGNVRQLTFGGENAEAYFSADGLSLIFQSTRDGAACDQIYTMSPEGTDVRRVSTGRGRTTCGFWFPDRKRLVYSSTHLSSEACPPPPDRSRGYVWALHDEFEIFSADPDGGDLVRLTHHPGYDAEATISEDGSRILFTSVRDGDVDLYTMNADGGNVRRITREKGYDGGGFFSPDGSRIVYRASRPRSARELEDWDTLLKDRLVRPTTLEIHIANADGSGERRITELGAASFAPCWFRDGKRILFSSNVSDPRGRNFDLYMIRDDGTSLERVTYNETFDGFPFFSPDGKRLVFASNRDAARPGETNIFIADWVP